MQHKENGYGNSKENGSLVTYILDCLGNGSKIQQVTMKFELLSTLHILNQSYPYHP